MITAESGSLRLRVDERLPCSAVPAQGLRAVLVHGSVEETPDRSRFAEQCPIVLTNDIEYAAECLRQVPSGRHCTIDRGARTSPVNPAPENAFDVAFNESCLDGGLITVRTDLILPCLLTAQESQRSKEERFPGSSLSSDDNETRTRFDPSTRDQTEVPDRKLVKHGRGRTGDARPAGTDACRAS